MKILLDECFPARLRLAFPPHEAHSARWAGFGELSNGRLLQAAENAGYEVIITTDQRMPFQQNLKQRAFIPQILATLETIQPGQVLTVPNN